MSEVNIKEHIHIEVNGKEQARLFTVVKSSEGFAVTIQKTKNETNKNGDKTINYSGFENETFPTKHEALQHVKAKVQAYLEDAFGGAEL